MSINFPSSLDSLTNPTTSSPLNNPSHAGQHSDANDAIEALEAKVGANSSAVESSHDYKLSTVTGSNKAETQGNKRTSFQATPTDTAYPSEKLVKDSLDLKAPLASPTFTGTVVLPKTLEIQDTSADHQYVLAVSELTADRTTTLPLLTGNDEFTFNAHTQTLTNKRITPRIVTAASYTTDTGTSLNCDTTDQFQVTAQAGALKLNNPSGTATAGQKLIVRIKDDGAARALTYDTQFRAMGVALPSTTVLSKTLYMGFIFNATDTKWDLVASAQEA